MRIEVLAIGDELLDGRVADTNTLFLASGLKALGHGIERRATVKDDIDVIVAEAKAIIARGTKLCVVSGGLGPTRDDLTRDALAALAGVELERVPELEVHLRQLFESRGRELTDNQLLQADRPKGAKTWENSQGTAPGFEITVDGCRFVCVPGVPREYQGLVQAAVFEPLAKTVKGGIERRHLRSFGLVEGEVDRRLGGIPEKFPGVRLGFRAHFPEIHISLAADGGAAGALDAAFAFAKEALGSRAFTEAEENLPQVLVRRLTAAGKTLALAESCTGGLTADLLTDVSGSSAVLIASLVCYANAAKEKFVGVLPETLEAHGAVSERVVLEMADGAAAATGADFALAISGIAGPGGGTPEKPVGTVWMALHTPEGTVARLSNLRYGRRRNKIASAYGALEMLRRYLDESPLEKIAGTKNRPIAP